MVPVLIANVLVPESPQANDRSRAFVSQRRFAERCVKVDKIVDGTSSEGRAGT